MVSFSNVMLPYLNLSTDSDSFSTLFRTIDGEASNRYVSNAWELEVVVTEHRATAMCSFRFRPIVVTVWKAQQWGTRDARPRFS